MKYAWYKKNSGSFFLLDSPIPGWLICRFVIYWGNSRFSTWCPAAHCGRRTPHGIFSRFAYPIVPCRDLPHFSPGLTARCRSLVWEAALLLLKQGHDPKVIAFEMNFENFISKAPWFSTAARIVSALMIFRSCVLRRTMKRQPAKKQSLLGRLKEKQEQLSNGARADAPAHNKKTERDMQ